MRTAKQTPVERPVEITEESKDFAELMEDVGHLEPMHQERVALFMQGYVAGATARNKATA